ncbi:hypothetical protein MRX96_036161 [Rhipicephalus microplus]
MKRNKSRRHSNSSKGEPQEVDNVQKERSVRSKATIPGGAAAGTDQDPGVLSKRESAQSDQPVTILSAKRMSSGSHRRRHRSKSGLSSDAAETTTEPKVKSKSKAAQQVPLKGEAAEAEQPAPNELAGITSGIGQYLQSLLPSHNSTAQEESAQKPPLQQNPPTTLPPLQQAATAWLQQAVPLNTMPRQALAPQAVLEASVLQQQSQSMPPVTPYIPPPQFPQPNFPIAQALPYAYGGMVPPWYGLPQQIPVGQTPLHFLPPLSVNPATAATSAPIMHPQAPPPIAASSAALTTKPEAASAPQANQPHFVTTSHYAHVEPSAVIAPVSATRETIARVAEPVPDACLHVADDFGKLSPPILSELPSVVQSPTSQSSHRRHSRRQFVLDGNAIDNTVASPQDAVAREDYNQSVSRVFKKQRSQHKNLHDEGHEFEEAGETQTFPMRHRDYRPSRGRRKGSEEPVDELTDQIVSPISTPISPPRSKGLPVIDDTYRSTAAGGVGAKGVSCRCCPYGARNDDVDHRQVSLEDVLRYEDIIRQDAQLEDRRRLLDEERIREDERLAFREYLAEHDLVLNDNGGHLPDTQLKEFKEALQRELAKRRNSRAKFEAAHSRPGARELPKVDRPSSVQARLVTEPRDIDLAEVPLRALREWVRGWLWDPDTRMVRFLGRLRDRDRDRLPSDRPSVESFEAWSSSAVALNSFIAS